MDRATLRALLEARHLTPEQLRAQNAQLATAIDSHLRIGGAAVPPGGIAARPSDDGAGASVRPHTSDAVLGLAGNAPLAMQPGVGLLVEKARLFDVGSVAGISEATLNPIVDEVSSPENLTEARLRALVEANKLTETQARNLGFAGVVYDLVGGDSALAKAIGNRPFARLGGRPPKSVEDLASLTAADLTEFLSAADIPRPAGTTPADLGAALADRFSAVHPTASFFARVPALEVAKVTEQIGELAPLFAQNAKVVGTPFERLKTTGLSPQQIETLKATHAALREAAGRYPGLELTRVLDDSAVAPGARAETVARRAGFIQKIRADLGDAEILHFDFSPGSPDLPRLKLDTLGASPAEQRMVLQSFKSYQRAFAVGKSVDAAHQLLAAGFTSGLAIGTRTFEKFHAESKFDAGRARAIWEDARLALADTASTAVSIADAFHGLFDDIKVGNTSPAAKDYLKKLAGFKDLFGNLSFCDCVHCQSILGPAAYFVALLKFVDEHLRPQLAAHPNHPLDLKKRRPDLWTLELTCENTTTRIPTLDIVNEILENDIASRLGFGGSLTDRGEIAKLVYEDTISKKVDSFRQPFHLPLARIASYLEKLGHARAEIADAIGVPAPARARAILAIAPEEQPVIANPDAVQANLSRAYGLSFTMAGAGVEPVDADELGRAMGLSREELGQLVATRLVAASGATLTITAEKRNATSVQNDIERVRGLTLDALDRMHRFTRAQRKLRWSIPEVDLALAALGANNLRAAEMNGLATLRLIEQRLEVSVEEVCAFVGLIPATPAGQSMFDRVFNPPSFVLADGSWPKNNARFIHPALREQTEAPADPALPRLLSTLGVDLDGLAVLVRSLAPVLARQGSPGFDPADPNEDERFFVLSAANLTLLYRHARLARRLGLQLADLFQLLKFNEKVAVTNADDLVSLLDLHAWWRASGLQLDDLAIAMGQAPRDSGRIPDADAIANAIVAGAAEALSFKDTVFAVALGTSEQASRDLLDANAALVETVGDSRRLKADVDLDAAAIAIPANATVPESPSGTRAVTADEVRATLRSYHASEVIARLLGGALGQPTAKIRALAALANQPLGAEALVRAVRGDGPIAPLRDLVRGVVPLAAAFGDTVWDAGAIDFVRQHANLFSSEPIPHPSTDPQHPLSLTQLRALSAYARTAGRAKGVGPGAPPVDHSDLQTVLSGFDAAAARFPATVDAELARALGVNVGLVVGLRGRVKLPAIAVSALDHLDRAARLATDLGVDGETLAAIVSDNYRVLSGAADALEAALRARQPDEESRTRVHDEAEEPVRGAKRDALTDHLARSIPSRPFKSSDDLYRHFLIDAEIDGCATTSRVVAAISSVQLYVHRVIMNLEQDDLPPTDPNHVALRMPAEPAAEWDWRKNYRVWEANRKVFLWPENYLEPDLRDDKTPEFRELEQELLQTDISDQNVLDAYAKYLKSFEEISEMTIAGAYHDVRQLGGRTLDVLHLFGVTSGDPPVYYYRTCEGLIASGKDPTQAAIWSPWQKMSVQITGRRVSPIIHRGRLHVFWTDIRTRSMSRIQNGASEFSGYRHKMSVRFTSLRPDGTWTAPQALALPIDFFFPGPGSIEDRLDANGKPMFDTREHPDPVDEYTLSGPAWDWLWFESVGERLHVRYRNFWQGGWVDLFARSATDISPDPTRPSPRPQILCAKGAINAPRTLHFGTPILWWGNRNTCPNIAIDEPRLDEMSVELGFAKPFITPGLYVEAIANLPPHVQLMAIPGSVEDGLIQVGSDVLLLQGSITDDAGYVLLRIGTTLGERIARKLFEDGIDGLLDIRTQLALAEAGLPINLVGSRIQNHSNSGQLDYKGPYGVYYRELFFHIPLCIANALNSRGRYAAAQRWFHYLFDPTATEVINVPAGTPPAEVPHRLLDRVWRYREFRNLDLERLRDILTDEVTIALYRKDPFNPHVIARRRISAYQKSVVMKYIDNLLDWGDLLFTQFTMESVNEALMLYTMAEDILGPRPGKLGDCGEGAVQPKTYEKIAPLIDDSSEILVELESWILGSRFRKRLPKRPPVVVGPRFTFDRSAVLHSIERNPLRRETPLASGALVAATPALALDGVSIATTSTTPIVGTLGTTPTTPIVGTLVAELVDPTRGTGGQFQGLSWKQTRTASWAPALSTATMRGGESGLGRRFEHVAPSRFADWVGRFAWCIVRQFTPVFCVPPNRDLLAFWDRVEDRLFKIRHCMDITGQKRELALFAPEIDPRLLVLMRAAGLTLEDVFDTTSGSLPPYRFMFLIDRAKTFAATLSSFGASLLVTLEKRDAEEAARLRLVQQQNITRMSTQLRRLEIEAAEASLRSLEQELQSAEYKKQFYEDLIAEDRNGWELTESICRHGIAAIHGTQATLGFLSATFHLIPQVGSAFAMKYGGLETGSSMARFAKSAGSLAAMMQAAGMAAGLEGDFARRSEGWRHQKKLAEDVVKSLKKQVAAADIRRQIAERALVIHETTIEQLDEMLELGDGRFTSLGLYTYLSTQLQRLYRSAYQNAITLAKLAERAFRFERCDDTFVGLSPTYWDTAHGGVLAGEQLLADLQTLERRYFETNYRELEVDQAFALSQIDPQALLTFRETGECEFKIQEIFFDLYYPGHFRRRIKGARLTIPCITGPYTNVSATLTLVRSQIRMEPTAGAELVEVPPQRSVSIATSTAQNDTGIFELSFRDERYMPFEGGGAVSRWSLRLPKSFRQFDYQTINDVILSISYTAQDDGVLRSRVESDNAQLEESILNFLKTHALKRVFSLRQEFSAAFTRLLHSAAGTQVTIEISDRHFPAFIRGRPIVVDKGVFVLRPAAGISTAGVELTIDGAPVSSFAADPTLGNLPAKPLPPAFTTNLRGLHSFVLTNAGPLAPTAPTPGDPSALTAEKLLDIALYIEYRLAEL